MRTQAFLAVSLCAAAISGAIHPEVAEAYQVPVTDFMIHADAGYATEREIDHEAVRWSFTVSHGFITTNQSSGKVDIQNFYISFTKRGANHGGPDEMQVESCRRMLENAAPGVQAFELHAHLDNTAPTAGWPLDLPGTRLDIDFTDRPLNLSCAVKPAS
jgi:hypothetical protein